LLGIDFRGAPRGNQQCGDGVRQAINHGLYALALAASTTASVGLHPSFVILDEHYSRTPTLIIAAVSSNESVSTLECHFDLSTPYRIGGFLHSRDC
jgi:hypothetical protein